MMIPKTGRPLILIVDDMPSNIHLLVAALKSEYRIKTALNGSDALELASRDDRPDLILLDMMMPEMSGTEVMRELRANRKTAGIPVIFVTADNSEQSQLEALELGADDYLTKPVLIAALLLRVRNLLKRKESERELQVASHVFNYSGEAIMITDSRNRIIAINTSFTRLTGYLPEEVEGKNPKIISSGRTTGEEYAAMWEEIEETGFWQGEMWDRRKDGGIYPKLLTISVVKNQNNEIDFYIGSFNDITRQKSNEADMWHTANHDILTGLPNRLHLRITLEQAMASIKRNGGEVALMFIDLDRFKQVNDTLGHAVGDELLILVAERLKSCIRESDIAARLGGDEFVVMMTDENVLSGARRVAEKILSELSLPYITGEHLIHSTPSIGISFFPHDGNDIEEIMKNADMAMYRAKESGRGRFCFFSEHDEIEKGNR